MNKAQFIETLASKSMLSKNDSKKVLNACIEIVTECMCNREEIVFSGFGTLQPRPQTSRLARNPKTGTPVMIQPRTSVKFKPGKYLLESINEKKDSDRVE
ncbi:DNA-binding protein HU-beta [Parabacteroides sp. PF5-6]|nr:HU family DNA-binding protein [Parabacteroides sp. PF5-6]MDF9830804.1 DNA-binding protein HU-beta [Parabacteroides sp. PF5-6]